MKTYNLVGPENYTVEQKKYIENYKRSLYLLSKQTNVMFLMWDVNSHFITGTDTSAKKYNMKSGADFEGKSRADLPCPTVAACAEQANRIDQNFIHKLKVNTGIETLAVYHYSDGLEAHVGKSRIFYHEESSAILGIISEGINIELKDFINIVPDYITRFGALGTLEAIDQNTVLNVDVNLNDYEQEICYLFLLGWDCPQVAKFMDEFRPNPEPRTADAVIKKKDAICHKLHLDRHTVKDLRDHLVTIGFHKKLPQSFFSRIIGTRIIK